ncbi:disulfide bond formation protein B [Alphaproteobacteria bacterium]|nr:disulfide bond formation protein B [Alphaproteobacteria bacterium]
MSIIFNYWIKIIFLLSIIAIGSALIAEYFFDLAPCEMCLKQRHPYYAIITLIIIFYFFNLTKKIYLLILFEVSIIYGLFYSLWHVGVEKKILAGPESCSGTLSKLNTLKSLKEQITNQAIVSCTDITWTILSLSAASTNSLLLLFILIFNSIFIVRKFYGS